MNAIGNRMNIMLSFAAAVCTAAACCSGADDVLILDEAGHGATGRFRVLDHEGEALGLMVGAENKFIAASPTFRFTWRLSCKAA